ncbi:carbon-nitrogen hydrolase family protein [Streptomyces sp. GTA36]
MQAEAVPGDLAGNARRAATSAVRAADQGARVVMFPELHLCGYDLATLIGAPDKSEVPADASGSVMDHRLDPLAEAAADHMVTVLVGAAVRRKDGTLTNSVLAVHPTGATTVAYDKQHLWHDDESRVFTPGNRTAILAIDDWRVGLGICYDLSFPEHARAAALAGAHAYLCPGAFAAGTEQRSAVYLAARALENTIYSAFANPVGGPDHRRCDGGTAVYGPDGSTICRAEPGQTTLHVELDPKEIARVRVFLRMLTECRTTTASSTA